MTYEYDYTTSYNVTNPNGVPSTADAASETRTQGTKFETAFDAETTVEDTVAGDTFAKTTTGAASATETTTASTTAESAANSGASADTSSESAAITANNGEINELNKDSGDKQAQITQNNQEISSYESRISRQDAYIERLENEILDLQQANTLIQAAIAPMQSRLTFVISEIARLQEEIDNAGILGGISNLISGKNKDLNNYINEKLSLEKQIKEKEDEIAKNNEKIDAKTESKTRTEGYKAQNENEVERLAGENEDLQEGIDGNNEEVERLTDENEELQQTIDNKEEQVQQQEQVSEPQSAPQASADAAEAAASGTDVAAGTDIEAAIPTGTTTPTDVAGAIPTGTALPSATGADIATLDNTEEFDILTGNLDDLSEEEIRALEEGVPVQVVEAVQTYEEEIGLTIDVQTLANAPAIAVDEVVEAAIVQNVIKTSAGKVMGDISKISNKKEMTENSDAVDDFQANFITLQNYYNTNDIYHAEVSSFLAVEQMMYDNLAQGATYDTGDLNTASNKALELTASLRSDVATAASVQDSDARFEDTKALTKAAIEKAEEKVGENENTDLAECQTEFITLTANYRNATTDSEKQQMIVDMQRLLTDAESIEENPDGRLYNDQRLAIQI